MYKKLKNFIKKCFNYVNVKRKKMAKMRKKFVKTENCSEIYIKLLKEQYEKMHNTCKKY